MFNSRGRVSLCIHARRAEHKRLLTGIVEPLQCQDSFLTTNIAGGILIFDKKESCDQAICVSSTVCDEAHFWLNGYVNKQNCRIWSEANPQVYVETPLHPEKLTVWCALWAGGILLQKR
ncbi:hypothetical protein TNCV_4573881 [Trichonephila clavipes]|nr:hypothetical protein TNCV_4573881 [Trichonephila clavipes]